MSKRTKKRKPSKIGTLLRMLGVVKPLTSYMILAVVAGTLAFLAVQFIPILGGYAILSGLGLDVPIPIRTIWILLPVLALLRAVLRFAEQRLNHYIAFTLLALVRDKVFGALRRLCPAKLEGKDKGDLVALITSDVELLEVFYAHTISPICIPRTSPPAFWRISAVSMRRSSMTAAAAVWLPCTSNPKSFCGTRIR